MRPNATASEEDTDGMAASVQQLEGLIKHEVDEEGIEEGQVVVGGFSQGASRNSLCRAWPACFS